jgi:hypothetical protein
MHHPARPTLRNPHDTRQAPSRNPSRRYLPLPQACCYPPGAPLPAPLTSLSALDSNRWSCSRISRISTPPREGLTTGLSPPPIMFIGMLRLGAAGVSPSLPEDHQPVDCGYVKRRQKNDETSCCIDEFYSSWARGASARPPSLMSPAPSTQPQPRQTPARTRTMSISNVHLFGKRSNPQTNLSQGRRNLTFLRQFETKIRMI